MTRPQTRSDPGPLSAANRAAPPPNARRDGAARAPSDLPKPLVIPAARWLRKLFGEEATVKHFAWLSLAGALGLSLLGLYAIDVASVAQAGVGIGAKTKTQGLFLLAGLAAALIVAIPSPQTIRQFAWPALAVCVALLIFLLIPQVPASIVRPRNGCRGWIDLGPFDLQPSELTKVGFVLASAAYLRYRKNHRTVRGLLPPAIITAVPVGLIMLQPDLGMALLFVPTIFAILLAAGARLKHLTIVVLAGALAVPAVYPFLKPYQQQRIVSMLTQITSRAGGPGETTRGSSGETDNFQSQTAKTLIAAGGLTGMPDAKARVIVQASRLPERHNDMVFAVIATRFGAAGAILMAGLYLLWFAGAWLTSAVSRDPFGRLVCIGFTAFVAAQALVNIGMNVGILPIIGITLPFVSYGGSSLVVVWIMTGVIFGIASRRPPRLARASLEFDRWE